MTEGECPTADAFLCVSSNGVCDLFLNKECAMPDSRPWAAILAGGDGRRLRPLTRSMAGDARPKQFCQFFGGLRYVIIAFAWLGAGFILLGARSD